MIGIYNPSASKIDKVLIKTNFEVSNFTKFRDENGKELRHEVICFEDVIFSSLS